MWEMSTFCATERNSPPYLHSFSQMVGLGERVEGVEQSTHGGGNKQHESRWKFFGKMGNAGGIIQEDNSAGHCFILMDLGRIENLS